MHLLSNNSILDGSKLFKTGHREFAKSLYFGLYYIWYYILGLNEDGRTENGATEVTTA
jgi:hypothetical protein